MFENLLDIYDLISKPAPDTAMALKEIIAWMKAGDSNKALVQFPFWWGRGQQYLSFINNQ